MTANMTSENQQTGKDLNNLPSKSFRRSRILTWFQMFVTPAALACLGYFGWTARSSILSIIESAEGWFWVSALLLLIIRNLSQPIPTVMILRGLGSKVSWLNVIKITIERLPARYIPGGIWHSTAQAVDLKNLGVPFDLLSGMLFLQQLLAIGTALIMGGMGLALFHPDRQWFFYGAGISVIAFVAIIAFSLITIFLARRRGHAPQVKYFIYASVLSTFFWLVPALAFDALVNSFPEIDISATSLLIGSVFLFSRGVGFLAIFAPQGIGVFEFVAAALLPTTYEATSVAVILFSFRIVGFVADTITYGAFMGVKHIPKWSSILTGRRDEAKTD